MLLIGVLIVAGAVFLAFGLDVPIPRLGYQGLPARDIPIGVVLVFAGIAVSRFWIVPQNENQLVEEWKNRKHAK
jgi:hypothetical protein